MAVDRITMRFAGMILENEWGDFEKRHRDAIERRIYAAQKKKSTGTLRVSRDYSVATNEAAMRAVATLKHPDYERFIDMKKKYMGKRGGKGIFQNRDVLFRKGGIPIHNRIIWGKLNPVSFRLMNELRVIVAEQARQAFTSRTLPYNM
jgi:hypothetical protein